LGYVAVGLGYAGLLNAQAFCLFFIAVLLVGWRQFLGAIRWLGGTSKYLFGKTADCELQLLQGVFLALVAGTFVLCLFPEISNDALAHHLNLPKRYLQEGKIAPLPFDIKSYQSLLMNSLYTVGLLLQGAAVAKGFHWGSGILLVLGLILWIEQRTANRKLAYFMGLMLFLTPTLMNQLTTTYVDIGAALFLFLGVFFWITARESQGSFAKIIMAGILMGFSILSKLSTLLAIPGVAIIACFDMFRRPSKYRTIALYLAFLTGMAITSGFFFIRNQLSTGDPLFPVFSQLAIEDFGKTMYDLGPPKTLLSYLLLPFYITFRPADYDYHHWIGPFYILALPFFIGSGFSRGRPAALMVFCFLYASGWYLGGQNVRYLLPILPLYWVVAASGFHEFFDVKVIPKWMKHGGKTLGGGVLILLVALTLFHFRWQGLSVLKQWDAEKYLRLTDRTYGIAEWANHRLPQDAHILSLAEVRLFYFDPKITRASMYAQFIPAVTGLSRRELANKLLEDGITHILISYPVGRPFGFQGLMISMPDLLAVCERLVRLSSENVREARYVYELYDLRGNGTARDLGSEFEQSADGKVIT
ncbi:MAG: glycosyltransferase family 39 protein, partial [Candidatus Omnitrophota bacterium]